MNQSIFIVFCVITFFSIEQSIAGRCSTFDENRIQGCHNGYPLIDGSTNEHEFNIKQISLKEREESDEDEYSPCNLLGLNLCGILCGDRVRKHEDSKIIGSFLNC